MAVSIELITTITITLMGIIIAAYILVLRRNGWIGKSTNYRCPNPACKKIFQNPMKVADLSDVNRSHLACPECGFELDSSLFKKKASFEIIKNETPIQNNYLIINKMGNQVAASDKSSFVNTAKSSFKSKPEIVTGIRGTQEIKYPSQIANTTRNTFTTPPSVASMKNNSETKPPLLTAAKTTPAIPAFVGSTSNTSESAVEPRNSNSNSGKAHKLFNKPSMAIQIKPSGCKFYLGYLYTLPKGTPIPYNCYACTRLIDCYKPLEDR